MSWAHLFLAVGMAFHREISKRKECEWKINKERRSNFLGAMMISAQPLGFTKRHYQVANDVEMMWTGY